MAYDLPQCVHEGSFQIGGLTMRVYHLDDGRRIFNAEDVEALFCGNALADATPDEMMAMSKAITGGGHDG